MRGRYAVCARISRIHVRRDRKDTSVFAIVRWKKPLVMPRPIRVSTKLRFRMSLEFFAMSDSSASLCGSSQTVCRNEEIIARHPRQKWHRLLFSSFFSQPVHAILSKLSLTIFHNLSFCGRAKNRWRRCILSLLVFSGTSMTIIAAFRSTEYWKRKYDSRSKRERWSRLYYCPRAWYLPMKIRGLLQTGARRDIQFPLITNASILKGQGKLPIEANRI